MILMINLLMIGFQLSAPLIEDPLIALQISARLLETLPEAFVIRLAELEVTLPETMMTKSRTPPAQLQVRLLGKHQQ
jgi:hypothetical protein